MFCKKSVHPFNAQVHQPIEGNLGSLIQDQMYHGVSSSNSTLLSGEFDDEDNFDVDPLCNMKTDRFDISSQPFVESAPDTPPPSNE